MKGEKIFQLLYTSQSLKEMDSNEVGQILEGARKYNTKKNITGLLLYIKNDFIQLLEGKKEEVLELYDSIKKDKRHELVRTLISCYADERLFVEWSMGYSHFDNMEGLEKYAYAKDIDLKGIFDVKIENKVHPALLLMRTFYISRNNENKLN
eukprot:TRINITY_DN7382_c0_g1_i1.p1 TRINITY_DN7382_c0_g1~~TRINITY_DN7382_c0_g1_i1.p1  ORF type:complete len:152 (-),score=27.46 TRINITY_DN7382_c0_g1_i1:10-465(-)